MHELLECLLGISPSGGNPCSSNKICDILGIFAAAEKKAEMRECYDGYSPIRGCLHDTGATFVPGRIPSGSLSWLYICLPDTTTKCHAGESRPSVSSPRLSYQGENFTPIRDFATVSCKRECPPVQVGSRSAGRLEQLAHA